jgi:hypothetical protein
MHFSASLFAVIAITTSTATASPKHQLNKYESCTDFGAEWCNDGEILTCHKTPFTDHGWVKGTQKPCVAKRQADKFEKCFNYGEQWCSDGEVLVCKKVAFVDQGRATSTHKKCAAKKKRGVGSWCDDLGSVNAFAQMLT